MNPEGLACRRRNTGRIYKGEGQWSEPEEKHRSSGQNDEE